MNNKTHVLLLLVIFFQLGQTAFAKTDFTLTQHLTPSADETLSLDHYLHQVISSNPGMKSSVISATAASERAEESSLALAPTAFVNLTVTSDARIPQFAFLGFSSFLTENYSVGVSKLTSFGLSGKIHYDLLYQSYINPSIRLSLGGATSSSGANPFMYTYAVASPVVEFTQNLWSNGFGRSTRATIEQAEAQTLAASYNASYQAKNTLVQAELAYWRLMLAHHSVKVQQEALDRAQKIYEWNERRARLHLTDESTAVQALASVQMRQLELTAALNEERTAARNFNSFRYVDSAQVEEPLPNFITFNPTEVPLPKRVEPRDDVKAQQQLTRSAIANSAIYLERDLPTLDLFGSLALNGQRNFQAFSSLSQSIPVSFSLDRPTATIGIRFSAPLDFGIAFDARASWRKEQIAAEKTLDQKVFQEEQDWKNLLESYGEAKQRWALSIKLESIQKDKLELERKRLLQGRTTTYQVLLFEQDYLLSQLTRMQNQTAILNLVAQMKLFGERV